MATSLTSREIVRRCIEFRDPPRIGWHFRTDPNPGTGLRCDRLRRGRLCRRSYAAAGVDGVITYDDMGTNDRCLVSPATFREIYFPRYKATIDRLHERGMHFIHHCCGQVREYLDLFVEAGLDVLQLDQPTLMGIEWLGKHCGGKLCFWNPVDIQTTVGRGDWDAIEDEARRQIRHLGSFGGGFMVKAYQQPESVGMTIAQAQRQYEAFTRWGTYPLQTPSVSPGGKDRRP